MQIAVHHRDDGFLVRERSPVERGMRGTVQSVDDIGQLLMKWDNGRALALIPGEDSFRRLTQEEVDRELQEQAQEQTINEQSM